ncbi:hypothetical protein GCM10011410_08790 [Hoyosella rhizosphaerae]|uniref:Uncharacterized protein n=1 Tax=Hoyosella rhizosphaerae TaxID=1755582 RepID=A0A916U3U9_9ACTN|nr:hypothetical protein GCM10011410_08790 [Hoyosella rhizosphaerae]
MRPRRIFRRRWPGSVRSRTLDSRTGAAELLTAAGHEIDDELVAEALILTQPIGVVTGVDGCQWGYSRLHWQGICTTCLEAYGQEG